MKPQGATSMFPTSTTHYLHGQAKPHMLNVPPAPYTLNKCQRGQICSDAISHPQHMIYNDEPSHTLSRSPKPPQRHYNCQRGSRSGIVRFPTFTTHNLHGRSKPHLLTVLPAPDRVLQLPVKDSVCPGSSWATRSAGGRNTSSNWNASSACSG